MNINLDGQPIERVAVAKSLGLLLDEQLNFRTHIAHIKKKILPIAYAIKRVRFLIPDSIATQLYFAHVYSHLIYLNPIWAAANVTDINDLFISQKKALKAILGSHHLLKYSQKTFFLCLS